MAINMAIHFTGDSQVTTPTLSSSIWPCLIFEYKLLIDRIPRILFSEFLNLQETRLKFLGLG